VASSDATNIESRIERDGDDYVINGRKWWTSGAMYDPRCKILIFMGKTDPTTRPPPQQSMILVPRTRPGVKVLRPLPVFGYDDAPHGHAEVVFTTCACRPRTSCSAKAAASRSRRAGSGRAASTTACA
jgi:acyl-CoA dehydrogenase